MKHFLIVAALIAVAQPAEAYEQVLPKSSMVCMNQSALTEGERAAYKGDERWFRALPCFISTRPIKAERIECEGRTCKIRYWSSDQSNVGYTFRSSMKVN